MFKFKLPTSSHMLKGFLIVLFASTIIINGTAEELMGYFEVDSTELCDIGDFDTEEDNKSEKDDKINSYTEWIQTGVNCSLYTQSSYLKSKHKLAADIKTPPPKLS